MVDKPKLIENLLFIDDKQGVVTSFRFNRMQKYFFKYKSNRNIVLKHRQGGFSTSVLGDMLTDCITIPHTQCAVVSHETHSTQRLLDRVQFFYDTMQNPKPGIGAESRSEKTFPELHSSIYVGTAGARAFGHGDTIRKALMSELSLYEDGEKVLNGVEDAVPLTGEITIECYDDQTEVLTDRGWLLFKDVLLTDKVLSKNLETNVAYWSGIISKIERPATELIHVTGKGIDFRVTPNHNIWARKSGTVQPFQTYQAKDLFNYSEWEFEAGFEWVGEEKKYFELGGIKIPMDLWLQFLGFFVSEGCIKKTSISYYQEGEYTKLFSEVIEEIASYFDKEVKQYRDFEFTLPSKNLASYLSNYSKPKSFPTEVLNLSKRQLRILFGAYMKGDGEKKRNRCVTVSPLLRDQLQEIGLKLGYRSNYVTKRERIDTSNVHHKECYTISFYKNTKSSVRHSRNQIRKETYSGMVYCLTIPKDHLLMIRRNCKTVWLQNCTPNGEGNVFYEKWIRAKEGKSPYKTFFFPWYWSADYTIPRGIDFVLPVDKEELSYSNEELELIESYHNYATRYSEWLPPNMTEGQIRWRRWKIGEKGGLFFEQYPEDEVSCFITIGNPVFDQFILTSLAQGAYEGEHHPQGWTFWRKPQEKFRYVIGVDTSAGAPEGSYSAAVVLNDLWEVCATFQARLDPHTFAGILKEMGKWYNTAELAVERNFTGYAVLEQLRDYPHIYYQRDFTTGKVTTQKGWWTSEQTRDLLMTVTKEKFSQLKMWDVNLIRQLRGYRYLRLKSKYREEAQTYDDLAMAMMIACVVKKVEGGARGYQGKVSGYSW